MATPTFTRISLTQFEQLLGRFNFTRKVNAVHMHHTWRPSRADFRGHETIVAMWRFHTQTNGWRDIAQHITIDPQGGIWLGRNWNLPPASAAGFNGNAAFGPFMFEMVGNFDHGFDAFDGAQKDTVLGVIAAVQERFQLPVESLRFHNAMSAKSCPGNGIDYDDVLREVTLWRDQLRSRGGAAASGPRSPFPDEEARLLQQALRALDRAPDGPQEPGDAELTHREHGHGDGYDTGRGASNAARASGLDTASLAALRPHLINLKMGRLSSEGEATSTAADVDAIFEQHLPRWMHETAGAGGKPRRVVFFAHGGLVSEGSGLQIAHKHVQWWLDNGVYPVYFIWETGFFETIGQLLQRTRQRGPRDVFDFTTDPLIELAARALQGPRIWGGMKASAEHAVDAVPAANPAAGGGAQYAAGKLAAFCKQHVGSVELHAVGHSAGSIFHAYFLPAAVTAGAPAFKSAHFLAPAIRVDTFKQQLEAGINDGSVLEKLTLYTMRRDQERKDDCARVYRKSLLYLIHHALEEQRETPILGLEDSLRADGDLKQLFALGQPVPDKHEVIWSPSPSDSGRSASCSRTHGGFDDDPPTMNSVLRRILDKADADPIVEYRAARAVAREWIDEVDWPEELQPGLATLPPLVPAPVVSAPAPAPSPPPYIWTPAAGAPSASSGGGRRRAVCVGIDLYPNPDHRLGGCVNDARRWEQALRGLGFETTLMVNGQATRTALEQQLNDLVSGSHSGDVIVFQYAGHGTQVDDLNGDEETDGRDEALCPVDFADGALYIDDDIAELFARIPPGVNMTCFMDCCHSGTNSRFAVGTSTRAPGPNAKARFITATPALEAAHKRFRQQHPGAQRAIGTGGRERMRDIKFSACQDSEVAWESGGSGEFTMRAMRVLSEGVQGVTNQDFVARVVAGFGQGARQRPMLDCADGVMSLPLLQPLSSLPMAGSGRAAGIDGGAMCDPASQALHTVHLLSQALYNLSKR